MLGDVRFVASSLQEPFSRTFRVRDRFLCRERLTSDDEERRLWVACTECLREMRAIDVRDEMCGQVAFRVWLERLGDHHRSQIRATNTDVHDGVDRLASVALPGATAHVFGERADMVQHSEDLLRTRLRYWAFAQVAQGNMQNSTILRCVDVLAAEHLIARLLNAGFANELQQGVQDRFGDEILGVVEQEGRRWIIGRRVLLAELAEAVWVLGEEILQDEIRVLFVIDLLEFLPRRVIYNIRKSITSKSGYIVRLLIPDASVPGIMYRRDGRNTGYEIWSR